MEIPDEERKKKRRKHLAIITQQLSKVKFIDCQTCYHNHRIDKTASPNALQNRTAWKSKTSLRWRRGSMKSSEEITIVTKDIAFQLESSIVFESVRREGVTICLKMK